MKRSQGMSMNWGDFLNQVAATYQLSPEQTTAFVERLKTENSGKSEAKLATELNIGSAAFKKRMTEVYDKFAISCPELATSNSRGKLEKLRACLTAKYNGGQDFGVSAQSNAEQQTIKEIHHNIPPAVPFERFIGRETKLEELHQQLQTSRQFAIVAVAGMGGVGKTELATQYAKQHLQNYQGGVCWLSAQGIDVGIQILRFAELKFKLIAPDDWELADRLRYCWQNWQKGDVLLVFDDVTDYKKQVQPYLPPESPQFKILLTTRLKFDRTLQEVSLGVLKPLAAMKLLKSLVGRERLKSEPWVARKICKFLGYLPLALELAGRYLDTMPNLSLENLLNRLEKKRLEYEAIAKVDSNSLMLYKHGVAEAFALSWEKLDENARNIAYRLSLYALAPIPLKFKWIENEQREVWEIAIANLQRLHLLQQQSPEIYRPDALIIYRLHPLIRQFFQMKLDESSEANEVKTDFAQKAAQLAKRISPQLNHEEINELTPFIPHIAEVAIHLSQYLSDEDLIWPFTCLGWFYKSQGLYQQAEPWLRQCKKVTKNRLGLEHRHFAASLNNLAALYRTTGRYSRAKVLYKQALELSRRLLGEEHTNVATSMNNLAELYCSTGCYSKAEELYKQALELSKKLLGEEHPDVANTQNNLAELYRSTGCYSEAEKLYNQALKLYKRLGKEKHLHFAIILNNLATLYLSTERYSEAEPFYKQALELSEKLLGKEHPDVANKSNNLAALYHSIERYSEAEPLYKQALELWQHLLGKEHPLVATTLNNLAELYCSTKRYREAEPLYKQALEIFERVLGAGHPDTIGVRGNYAKFLREAYR